MARKLLISRLGAGSITIALCAALPGCNLAIGLNQACGGDPGSRNMSSVKCPDAASDNVSRDVTADSPRDTPPAVDTAGDR
jgi:hypothetical protein